MGAVAPKRIPTEPPPPHPAAPPPPAPPPPPKTAPAAKWLLVVALPVAMLGGLLLASAKTWEGRLAAMFAIDVLVFTLAVWRLHRATIQASLAFAVLSVAVLVVRAPVGHFTADDAVRTVYLRPGQGPHPYWPTNLVPEVDQLSMGSHLVWTVDPIMNARGAERLRNAIQSVYLPTQNDPRFRAIPSAFDDVLTDADRGRVDIYVPTHGTRTHLPVVVFLHGSAGSWQGYFRLWVELAERERFIVVQPSFGFGQWARPEGQRLLDEVRAYVLRELPADRDRMVLACLSNGGRAVTRAMVAHAPQYRGVVFLSAVIEDDVLDNDALEAWADRPALVVHGANDDRIAMSWLNEGVAMLRAARVDVTLKVVEGEDHFLIFTQPQRVFREVGAWLRTVWSAPHPRSPSPERRGGRSAERSRPLRPPLLSGEGERG